MDWSVTTVRPPGEWVESARSAFRAVREAKRRDAALLITHSPRLTIQAALAHRLLGARPPHLAFSFHYDVDPPEWKRRLIARTARHIDRFVVYSRAEVDVYHELFEIPRERITPFYWGIRIPEPPPLAAVPDEPGSFLSAIGGSARDYRTLFEAMERLPRIPMVAVMRPQNLRGLRVPGNVRVWFNLPYGEVVSLLAASRSTVIPLIDRARSGHSIAVLAMHLGKPVLLSDVAGVRESLIEGQTALGCPPGDPAALAARIARLWEDGALRERLAEGGIRFAREHCTEDAVAGQLRGVLGQFGLQ